MKKPLRIKSKTRDAWLSKRQSGIGASEAAAIVGLSPWMTASDLYEIKTGLKKAPDLSNNADVQRGVRMEDAIRHMYKAMNPNFKVTYHQYDMLYMPEREFMFATLDGEIKDDNGRKGILEIKASTPNGKAGWAKWNGRIPDAYAVQLYHQLACTGYAFADLVATLINRDNDITIRTYHYERTECEADIAYLIEKETEFWNSVQNRSIPPMTILF